jgi:hypothetical protein
MARIPNYGQQRAERNRGKQAKAEAKQRERDARKVERQPGDPAEPGEGGSEGEGEGDTDPTLNPTTAATDEQK